MTPNPPDAELRDLLRRYRRIAVVGLSDRPDRPSYGVAEYLQHAGYDITPVNPTIEETLGLKAVDSLQEVAPPVEIVDVFRRAADVPPVVDDAIAVGAKVVWLQLGIVNEEAAARAREAGLVVVQDACLKVEHRRLAV
ncbi:MAG TPA: CoA-binding protein [Chloroflexota bacterium]|nr:CoA-binding protein [Chloroflexota bacterium]